MITAVIVLSVVALALGGYILFDILYGRKKKAAVNSESAGGEPQTTEEEVTPAATKTEIEEVTLEATEAEEAVPAATKTETEDTDA